MTYLFSSALAELDRMFLVTSSMTIEEYTNHIKLLCHLDDQTAA